MANTVADLYCDGCGVLFPPSYQHHPQCPVDDGTAWEHGCEGPGVRECVRGIPHTRTREPDVLMGETRDKARDKAHDEGRGTVSPALYAARRELRDPMLTAVREALVRIPRRARELVANRPATRGDITTAAELAGTHVAGMVSLANRLGLFTPAEAAHWKSRIAETVIRAGQPGQSSHP